MLPIDARRRPEEVAELYKREPQLADVWVEGRTDRLFFDHVFQNGTIRAIEINDLDLSNDSLIESGYPPNSQRSRVLWLARFLNGRLHNPSAAFIRCVVDTDFDRILSRATAPEGVLRFTDYTCLESYWFQDDCLEKYRRLGLHEVSVLRTMGFVEALSPALRELYLLRAAAEFLGLELSWLQPSDSLSFDGRIITVRTDDFLSRWLNKNSAHSHRAAIVQKAAELDGIAPKDPRHVLHKDDLFDLLTWLVRRYVKPSSLANRDVVERTLACCIDASQQRNHPLFAELTALNESALVT